MTRTKLILFALLLVSIVLPASAEAQGLSISIGDRGYYTHGNSYWDHGYRMYWVPGHRGPRGRWIHGHYVRRGSRRANWDRGSLDLHDGIRANFR